MAVLMPVALIAGSADGYACSRLEACGLFRTTGGVALAVTIRAHARELTPINDQISAAAPPPLQVAFTAPECSRRRARLRRQTVAHDEPGYAIARHRPPG